MTSFVSNSFDGWSESPIFDIMKLMLIIDEKIIEKYEKDKYVVLHSSNITNMLLIALYNPFTKKRIIIKQKDKIITIKVT